MGQVISFMNNKGGVGKTTTAFNIGMLWSRIGKKVLFIDLDAQANLTKRFSYEDERYDGKKWASSIEDDFELGPKLTKLSIYDSKYENVDFVPANLKLSNFETATANSPLRMFLLKDLLKPFKDNYDYIIIDCPPALGSIIMNAMIASDAIVIMTTADQDAIDGIEAITELYNAVVSDERLNDRLDFLGCVMTRVKKDNINRAYISAMKERFGGRLIEPYINESTSIRQSISRMTDIFTYNPKCSGAMNYMEVGKELLSRLEMLQLRK